MGNARSAQCSCVEAIMSVSGISGSTTSIQSQYQQVREQFKKLSQDLQSGDLTDAQTDFVTLSQSFTAQTSANSPFGQALSKIGQDIQSGDLTAAQDALNALRKVGPNANGQGSHVPPMAAKLSQGLDALSQALQSGNLTAAQQAFSAVQQVWQQLSGAGATSGSQTSSATSGISVSS